MHSISLGPSEKNSFCAKAQRRREYVRSLGKKPQFWPSQRLKKVLLTTQGCAMLRTCPIIMQIPRGYQKKSLLCRKARYVRSLGKKPHFWPSQMLKKVLLTMQGCERLRRAAHWPNNNANPSGISEKKVHCVERRDMCDP